MILQEILFIARSRLRDLGIKKFSEAELIASINEGICDMSTIMRQAREDYFLTTTTSNITPVATPNPSVITLPTDFLELKDLWVTSDGWTDINFLASDRTTTQFRRALLDGGAFGSGSGMFLYDIYGNNTLILAPGTDVPLTIKIDYIQMVPDLHLPSDTPSLIPEKYHNDIPDYAVLEALRSIGDPRTVTYEKKVEKSEKLFAHAIQPRQVREPRFVTGYMSDDEW